MAESATTIINEFDLEDELYQFMEQTFFKNKKREDGTYYVSRSFFNDLLRKYRELSADWDKKTSPPKNPKETRARKGIPLRYAVIAHSIEKIRSIKYDPTINYTPLAENPAHCDILYKELENPQVLGNISKRLSELAIWKINFNDPL